MLDEDTFGHDFIGEARVPLKQLHPHQTKHFNVYLDLQHPVSNESFHEFSSKDVPTDHIFKAQKG